MGNTLPLKYSKTAFIWLFIAALLGLFLRWQFVVPTSGVNYTFFLHAHSHVMLLGWLFNAMMALYSFYFLPESHRASRKYQWFFWLFQISVLGMLIWFPIQGYKAVSIAFSSLHIFASYALVYFFWKDSQATSVSKLVKGFLNMGWLFHLISTIGPFVLGVIMAKGLKEGPLDELAVYYYLHFQYNGLFVFAIFALFFQLLDRRQISYSQKAGRNIFYLMVISCILGYALSTLWVSPPLWVWGIAWVSAILKMGVLALLFQLIWSIRHELKRHLHPFTFYLFVLAGLAFGLKHILQFLSAFEYIAMLAYQIRNLTIAYLHLVFLGVLTLYIVGALIEEKLLLLQSPSQRWGIQIMIIGILATETLLALQVPYFQLQAHLPNYFQVVFIASVILAIGIGLMLMRKK